MSESPPLHRATALTTVEMMTSCPFLGPGLPSLAASTSSLEILCEPPYQKSERPETALLEGPSVGAPADGLGRGRPHLDVRHGSEAIWDLHPSAG